jgi:predicted ATPase
MRIAITGSHRTGKTTLIEALGEKFPHYQVMDEPYRILEEEGFEFCDPPTLEDYEEQIDCSITIIKDSDENTFFDRSPLDCLAYAMATDTPNVQKWRTRLMKAVKRLDLIVFIPIESRIVVSRSEDNELRSSVDEILQSLILDDSLGVLEDVEVLEVVGNISQRIELVSNKMREISTEPSS